HRLFCISTPLGYTSVYEMGENYGPGYRVFYGIVGRKIILLRAGSTKKDQNRAIAKAPNTYISAPAAMIAKSSASWGAYRSSPRTADTAAKSIDRGQRRRQWNCCEPYLASSTHHKGAAVRGPYALHRGGSASLCASH